jgi:hypothetical protein
MAANLSQNSAHYHTIVPWHLQHMFVRQLIQ